jgi:alpha-L-rhamnosidase
MTDRGKLVLLAVTLALCPGDIAHADPGLSVRDLRCEYLASPLGIDTHRPRLSWVLEVEDPKARGQLQTSYQVLVASSRELLQKDQGDLWNSGVVRSGQSLHVDYAGSALVSRQDCYWKVRVWDRDGRPAAWSGPAYWKMGLLQPIDWHASWVTMEADSGPAHPWFRRTFSIDSDVASATVYVNTPSHYELYLNGKKVGTDVFMPAETNVKKRFLYNVYDVSKLLQKGKNVVALWMGPGWYQKPYGNPYNAPIVRAQLEINGRAGQQVIGTDSTWRTTNSCISQIGTWYWNNFGGERWDAQAYVPEWNTAGFDDHRWASAKVVPSPDVQISWQALPGNVLRSPVRPARIYPHGKKWIVDFGITLTGWMRLRMSGLKRGLVISMDYADVNDSVLSHMPGPDGFQTFNQRDVYVAADRNEDEFSSKFNQHGFRYVLIEGLSRPPTVEDAQAMTLETDLETSGDFSCSNDLFNQIHRVSVNTYHSQIPCGVLGGGEPREKLGYGDGGSFLTGMLYNLRSDAFFRKWLTDWCDGQREDGFLSHTAPSPYPAGGGPSWGGQASELAFRLDLYFADRRAVESVYPTLKKYVDYLESLTEKDILRPFNPYSPGKFEDFDFLGDWTAPGLSVNNHGFTLEPMEEREFFNNCYRIMLWEQLSRFASLAGDQVEMERCQGRISSLRTLVHHTYFDAGKQTYKTARQAGLVIALRAGIVPAELRPTIFGQLEQDVVVKKKGHLDTGLQGSYMLLDLLTKERRNDLVDLIMNQTTFPGWGYLLKERKVNTWPETWSGWGSQLILVVASPGSWFYEGLAGIMPDPKQPGFKHFFVRPGVVESVDWVKCRFASPYGDIVGNWKKTNRGFELEVKVPVNTTATVSLPAADGAVITESGKDAAKANGVDFLRKEDGLMFYELASGSYKLRSSLLR